METHKVIELLEKYKSSKEKSFKHFVICGVIVLIGCILMFFQKFLFIGVILIILGFLYYFLTSFSKMNIKKELFNRAYELVVAWENGYRFVDDFIFLDDNFFQFSSGPLEIRITKQLQPDREERIIEIYYSTLRGLVYICYNNYYDRFTFRISSQGKTYEISFRNGEFIEDGNKELISSLGLEHLISDILLKFKENNLTIKYLLDTVPLIAEKFKQQIKI